MVIPHVTETPITHGTRRLEDVEPRETGPIETDRRAQQRELVRDSLDRELHTRHYARETEQ